MKRSLLFALGCFSVAAHAEEGMWLFNDFPSAQVKKAYGFEPNTDWLERVRLSSVRLANGCSASFVSPNGLVMTNHHCIRACLEDLSRPGKDLLEKGFYAAAPSAELQCPKVEANQLVAMTDVTEQVRKATAGKEGAEFQAAQKAALARIESSCAKSAEVRCDVVTLFHGGKYHLYQYRRFQDVRLVFAPEFSMAAFGGDPDNFNFPRYGFDVAFLRVYQGTPAQPAETPHHFPWADAPAKEGDLTFVSGHPGGTDRGLTVAQLEFQRDVVLPHTLLALAELRGRLTEFSQRSAKHASMARSRLRSVENGLKALRGRHATLAEPAFWEARRKQEQALRTKVRADRTAAAQFGGAWDAVAQALDRARPMYAELRFKEGGAGFQSELFAHARALVRAADELPKPNGERLREFTDAALPALKQQLFSAAPVPRELEELTLAHSLTQLRDTFGPDDAFVATVLGKVPPEKLARDVLRGTRLWDAHERQRLFEGGRAALERSKDPMVQLALRADPGAREVRKRYEEQVESALKKNGELLAQAQLFAYGTSGYPDATFTLRLSYGQVKGWDQVKPLTTFAGLFDRHTGSAPFALTPRWLSAKGKLDLETPMNLATTNDIIGGNSGSPMVNREGKVVGLVFDGNLHSLGGRYVYDGARNRAVAVHGSAILAGLRDVYGARRVADELAGSNKAASGAR